MTADHTHGTVSPLASGQEDMDGPGSKLWYARAVISDTSQHDDETILTACEIVSELTDSDFEFQDAADLSARIKGPDQGEAA